MVSLPPEIWIKIFQIIKRTEYLNDHQPTEDIFYLYFQNSNRRSSLIPCSKVSTLLRRCALLVIWNTLHLKLNGRNGLPRDVAHLARFIQRNRDGLPGLQYVQSVRLVMSANSIHTPGLFTTCNCSALQIITDRISWNQIKNLTLVYDRRDYPTIANNHCAIECNMLARCAIGCSMLASCANLSELCIEGDPGPVELKLHPTLRTVRLSFLAQRSRTLVSTVLALPKLSHLVLASISFIEPAHLVQALRTMGLRLRTLYIDDCSNLFNDNLVAAITAECTNLTRLEIQNRQHQWRCSDRNFILPHLQHVRLVGALPRDLPRCLGYNICSISIKHKGGPFSDIFFRTIADRCPYLATLTLNSVNVQQNVKSSVMCEFITKCQLLTNLKLYYINVDNAFIAVCTSTSTRLRELQLEYIESPCVGKGIKHLDAWSQIDSIKISISKGQIDPDFKILVERLFKKRGCVFDSDHRGYKEIYAFLYTGNVWQRFWGCPGYHSTYFEEYDALH
ncbi:hypothetical protein BC938DRAFT_473711 [Jimgerdemannia flammicorona]|uniref:F-box domain-containing protein n=1 Tax=Jimgerdemannia flammicorona TaxID=994334 RepID=A0A433QT70_9FUNG|nr:hypothetical protein BC938DRAFT_473711 [Jimgerdemannia flammicorona]